MKHSNETKFYDLQSDLKDIEKKMTKHRERLNEIRRGDDEEAKDIAVKLLESSMASVGSIERDAELLLGLCRSAFAKYPYLR